MRPTTHHASCWGLFLKATGLRLLKPIFYGLFGRCFPCLPQPEPSETPKPIFLNSYRAVFARLAVHIFPILASITIISLNLCHLYLGRSLPGPITDIAITDAILQVVAKLQELLICASLADIIFSVVRGLLISGTGIPLGILSSGFMFPNLSFFWSMEFWGGVRSKMPLYSKVFTFLLLVAAGIIAATAGPSVAVLLVPKIQWWPAGGTDFYLRGAIDELYPTNFSGDEPTLAALCLGPNATNYAICPSSGYSSLKSFASFMPRLENDPDFQFQPTSITGDFGNHWVNIASTLSAIPPSQLMGNARGFVCQTSAIAPYLPAMMYQSRITADWNEIVSDTKWESGNPQSWSRSEYNYEFGVSPTTPCQVPAVRTACSVAQNVSATASNVTFPMMPEYACWKETAAITIPQMNSTPSDSLRVTWTQLPPQFGSTSAGMVFEAPWADDGKSRIVVGCSVDARWANGWVGSLEGYASDPASPNNWETRSGLWTPFRPPVSGSWRLITLAESWLQLLMPTRGSSNAFQSILESSDLINEELRSAPDQTIQWNDVSDGSSNRTLYLEWITTLVLADGISRYGTERVLNMTGPATDWSLLDYTRKPGYGAQLLNSQPALQKPNGTIFETFSTEISINGLAYMATAVTDYLAIVVLLSHMVLAVGYFIYLLCTRKTSEAWDSFTEVLTLAHNSYPTSRALQNTSTGIRSLQTYTKMAAVRVIEREGTGNIRTPSSNGHVELVFFEDDGSDNASPPRDRLHSTWPIVHNNSQINDDSSSEIPFLAEDINLQSRNSNNQLRPSQRQSMARQVEVNKLYS